MQANTILWQITENYLTKLAVNSNLWKIDFRDWQGNSIAFFGIMIYDKKHSLKFLLTCFLVVITFRSNTLGVKDEKNCIRVIYGGNILFVFVLHISLFRNA